MTNFIQKKNVIRDYTLQWCKDLLVNPDLVHNCLLMCCDLSDGQMIDNYSPITSKELAVH